VRAELHRALQDLDGVLRFLALEQVDVGRRAQSLSCSTTGAGTTGGGGTDVPGLAGTIEALAGSSGIVTFASGWAAAMRSASPTSNWASSVHLPAFSQRVRSIARRRVFAGSSSSPFLRAASAPSASSIFSRASARRRAHGTPLPSIDS